MALQAGTKLGPYEILSPIGAGGMGEVYLAKDSKLDRQVAIKVLPETMTRDKERVARFEREAKLLASLNHPNIAAIHGFDDSDGTRFLVMEYVEGETLGSHLITGPIAVEDVERLTPSRGHLDIFTVVDKLGDTQGTLPRLQRLLEEQDPAYVFLMLVRQFRLMILARRAMEIGEDPIASMNVPPFVARKVSAQSQQFTTSELKGIYQRFLDLDVSVKRGEADLPLDLIPLVAGLS